MTPEQIKQKDQQNLGLKIRSKRECLMYIGSKIRKGGRCGQKFIKKNCGAVRELFFHIEHSQKVGEVIIKTPTYSFFFYLISTTTKHVCKYKAIFTKNNFDCRFDNHNFT